MTRGVPYHHDVRCPRHTLRCPSTCCGPNASASVSGARGDSQCPAYISTLGGAMHQASVPHLFTLALLLSLGSGVHAQTAGLATDTVAIRAAVLTALEAEQSSFEARDCQASVGYFADLQPLFVVSGRVIPSRTVLERACSQMVATRGGPSRELDGHVIHVLSTESAFSVSIYRIPPRVAGDPPTRQVVTKVWILRSGAWRIGHMHESTGPWTPPGLPGVRTPPA